ncbi:NUDIX hydrolase [candidate division WWE3 bacterium]|uniref:NUDIX hydrolase n=1 Tax=candidate division WWE3 bacterium TaxID=2053526 RepID=A0A955LWG6_UNCKA|nr:NUDIX hydrolase [candidate division WWE3 bacterium]
METFIPEAVIKAQTQEATKELHVAKAIILNDKGELLLVERGPSQKFDQYKYELPGGKIDPGETPDEALLREVLEETGLDVTLPDQLEMEDHRIMEGGTYDGVDAVTHLKVAMANTDEVDLPALENPEHISVRWVNKEELQEMIDNGEVSKTVMQALQQRLLSDN